MDQETKRTNILAQIKQSTAMGLSVKYKPLIEFDDQYNLAQELRSEISKIDWAISDLKQRLAQAESAKKAIQEQTGSDHISAEQAAYQGLEVLANQLAEKNRYIENYTYSIQLKTEMLEATKDFFLAQTGKPYQKYTSKNGPVRQLKFKEARQWYAKNSHLIPELIK